jgi:hypothetical protein
MAPSSLDPRARAAEKEASREEDAKLLREEGGAERLRARNGKFAFPAAIVDFSSARRHW